MKILKGFLAFSGLVAMLASYSVSFYMSYCVWKALGFSMWKWVFLSSFGLISMVIMLTVKVINDFYDKNPRE